MIRHMIFIALLLVLYKMNYTGKTNEEFNILKHNKRRRQLPKWCPNCGEKDRVQCDECISCGYCITEKGSSGCVPGDLRGPFFREDCSEWKYDKRHFVNILYPDLLFDPYYNKKYYNYVYQRDKPRSYWHDRLYYTKKDTQ